MEQLVTSDFKLGIIAGGQLGKMLALAASNWDIKTYVMDADDHCPAATVSTQCMKGDRLQFDDVYRFGQMVDMITFEIESINIEALKQLKKEGKRINPDPEVLEIIQDKGLQKEYYRRNSIPTPDYKMVNSKEDILAAIKSGEFPLPLVQKLRTGGYDGRGVVLIRKEEDLPHLLDGPSIIEHLVDIHKEISVIVARNRNGEIRSFPAVEMDFNQEENLVERLVCPSTLDPLANRRAVEIAEELISSLSMSGLLAVEMFADSNNNIWVNESAPRPHNSGHHTIDSVITSQYEQLLRAIFNFSLGSTQLKLPSVMINLLGEEGYDGSVKYEGLTECMGIEGVKIHLYGKKMTRPFRKMGHVTVLAKTIEEAKEKADMVKQKLKVKSW
jgi:5-(carboxyamino)imidazole ribonucleotide synthase